MSSLVSCNEENDFKIVLTTLLLNTIDENERDKMFAYIHKINYKYKYLL